MSWFFQPLVAGSAVQLAGGSWDGTLSYSASTATAQTYALAASVSPTYSATTASAQSYAASYVASESYSTTTASSHSYTAIYSAIEAYSTTTASANTYAANCAASESYSTATASTQSYAISTGSTTNVNYSSTTASAQAYLCDITQSYSNTTASAQTYSIDATTSESYSTTTASASSAAVTATAYPDYSSTTASAQSYVINPVAAKTYSTTTASASTYLSASAAAPTYSTTTASSQSYSLSTGVALTDISYSTSSASSQSYAALYAALTAYTATTASDNSYVSAADALKSYIASTASANSYAPGYFAYKDYTTSTTSVGVRRNELFWSTDLRNSAEAAVGRPWGQYVDGNTKTRSVEVVGPFGEPVLANRLELEVTDANIATQKGTSQSQSGRPDNTNYTVSVYVKAGEVPKFRMLWSSKTASTWPYIVFNLSTGAYALSASNGVSPVSGSIVDMGNGWWRCIGTFPSGVAGSTSCGPSFQLWGASNNYTGNANDGLFIYGPQVELGSAVTDYQPVSSGWGEVAAEYRALEAYTTTTASSQTYSAAFAAYEVYSTSTASSNSYVISTGQPVLTYSTTTASSQNYAISTGQPILSYSTSTASAQSYSALYNAVKSYATSTTSIETHRNELDWSTDLRSTSEAGISRPWNHIAYDGTDQNLNDNAGVPLTQIRSVFAAGMTGTTALTTRLELASDNLTWNELNRGVFQMDTRPTNTTYTVSVYAKAGEVSNLAIQWHFVGNPNVAPRADFDLTNGASGNSNSLLDYPVAHGTVDAGNGWYRCWATFDTSNHVMTSKGPSFNLVSSINGYGHYGPKGDGLFLYGPQVELGSVLTPYQATTDAWGISSIEANTTESYAFSTTSLMNYIAGYTAVASYLNSSVSANAYALQAMAHKSYVANTTSASSYAGNYRANVNYFASTASLQDYRHLASAIAVYLNNTYSVQNYVVTSFVAENFNTLNVGVSWQEWETKDGYQQLVTKTASLVLVGKIALDATVTTAGAGTVVVDTEDASTLVIVEAQGSTQVVQ